jgi:hypothetical protein
VKISRLPSIFFKCLAHRTPPRYLQAQEFAANDMENIIGDFIENKNTERRGRNAERKRMEYYR